MAQLENSKIKNQNQFRELNAQNIVVLGILFFSSKREITLKNQVPDMSAIKVL